MTDEQLAEKSKVLAQLYAAGHKIQEPAQLALVEGAITYAYRIGYRMRETDEIREEHGLS